MSSWAAPGATPPRVARNVVLLGAVSLLTDVSSEMLYPIIPLYLTGVLGAPMTVVGAIEGLAESTASLLKLFSGRMADRWPRRMPLVFAGYGLSALSRPALALATTWPAVLGCRLLDRTGKGLRGPARDAVIAASTPPGSRGRAFGLHRSMDTVGAVLGPLAGMVALAAGLAYRSVFLLAAVPALAAIPVLLAVREPERSRAPGDPGVLPPSTGALADLSGPLRRFLLVTAVFSLGNSSNTFILLRARDLGWSAEGVIGMYVLYNIVYAAAATPLGALSDRVGRQLVLGAGFVTSGLVYLGLGATSNATLVPAWIALYGLYAAATAGAGRAYVADLARAGGAATAQGAYQMVTGLLVLVASLVAGWLWSTFGAQAAFLYGAATSIAAAALFAALCRGAAPGGRQKNGGADGN